MLAFEVLDKCHEGQTETTMLISSSTSMSRFGRGATHAFRTEWDTKPRAENS